MGQIKAYVQEPRNRNEPREVLTRKARAAALREIVTRLEALGLLLSRDRRGPVLLERESTANNNGPCREVFVCNLVSDETPEPPWSTDTTAWEDYIASNLEQILKA